MTFQEWYWGHIDSDGEQSFGDTKKGEFVSSLEEIMELAWNAGYEQGYEAYVEQYKNTVFYNRNKAKDKS